MDDFENRLDPAEIYIQGIIDDARRDRLAYAKLGETARAAHDEVKVIEKRLENLYEELKRLRERRESGNGDASEQKG
jgi:septation ring formation regulator EzrA